MTNDKENDGFTHMPNKDLLAAADEALAAYLKAGHEQKFCVDCMFAELAMAVSINMIMRSVSTRKEEKVAVTYADVVEYCGKLASQLIGRMLALAETPNALEVVNLEQVNSKGQRIDGKYKQ
jgi:hypothetical protein